MGNRREKRSVGAARNGEHPDPLVAARGEEPVSAGAECQASDEAGVDQIRSRRLERLAVQHLHRTGGRGETGPIGTEGERTDPPVMGIRVDLRPGGELEDAHAAARQVI